MSGGVRRSHWLALAALAALLLLLLAAHAPSAPRPLPRPLPRPQPPPPPAPHPPPEHVSRAQPANSQPQTHSSSLAAVTQRNGSASTTSTTTTSTARPREPGVQYTGDLWVAGHERPHPDLCPSLGARLALLILVTSAPSHQAARDAVRLTWGHYAARSDVALGFVLGAPPEALRGALAAEDALYGDLIVARSLDSYSNLTLKTLSMLEWADTYCPRVPHVLKTDDDMFINVGRLLKFAAARVNATKRIWGKVVKKSLPKRTTKSKYYVSPKQFPGKVFPDFATGPAYLLSGDCIRPLLAAAAREPYLRLEDVFVTGVLAQRLGIRREHAAEFYNRKVGHPCAVQRGIAVHMVRYHEQFDLWRKLLDGKTKCAS